MTTPSVGSRYAAQASEVASKLQPGTYEAVQPLAFLSIAQSLAQIADSLQKQSRE